MITNRNTIVGLIDHGNHSLELGNKQQASLAYYQAGKELLQLAKNKRGIQRRTHNIQAKKLLEHAQKLEYEASIEIVEEKNKQQTIIKASSTAKPITPSVEKELQSFKPLPIPDIRFNDVVGVDEVVESLKAQTLLTWNNPEMAKRYGQKTGHNILFYGPPGTGKTLLVKALAGELGIPLYSVKVSDLLDKYVGGSEKNVAELFATARKHPKAIVFIDELDALAIKRDGDTPDSNKRLVSQFLTELDGLTKESNQSLLFVGACNYPWQMDSAILRRLNPYYLGLPDLSARKKLFALNLKPIPHQKSLDLTELAEVTEKFSGSDIARLIEMAGSYAFREAVKQGQNYLLGLSEFKKALQFVKRVSSDEELNKYLAYQKQIQKN